MLYTVIENFRNGDAVPVYRRFRDPNLARDAPSAPCKRTAGLRSKKY